MLRNGFNPNGANKWFASKKVFFTTLGLALASACTYMATHDPDPDRQNKYMIGAIVLGAICGMHVNAEAQIDAAAVKKETPETTITNTNVEKPE